MHPQEFVAKMIEKGDTGTLIKMIDRFSKSLFERKTSEHAVAYNFVKKFLITLEGQLRLLKPGLTLDDDCVLRVWADLGLLGIEPEYIQEFLENPRGGK